MRPASDERQHKRQDGTSRRSFGNPEADFLDFSGVGSPLKKAESIEHR